MKKLYFIPVFFVILLSIFLFYSCNKKQNEVIKIGAIFDETGSLSYMGKWSKEGALLALEEINNRGGLDGKKVELIIEDGATDPNKTVSAFQKLINNDNISIVIGFNSSSGIMASAPIANSKKIVILSSGAASPNVTEAGDYIFRNRLSGKVEVEEIAKFIIDKQNEKETGIIFINNDYGKGYEEIFKNSFIKSGGKVLIEEAFQQDQSDFKTVIKKFKENNVKCVYLIAYAKEGGTILKQAKELNFNSKWYSANAIEGPQFIEIAGKSGEDLIYSVAKFDINDSLTFSFNANYKKKYGYDAEMFAANTYDALNIAVLAVSIGGKDGEKIKNYLYKIHNYPGVSGLTSFDSNGDVIKPVMMKIVKEGKFVPYNF